MSDCDAWEPPPPIKLLVGYAESYLAAFNARRHELLTLGQPLALFGEELTAAAVVLGDEAETAAVFYFTEPYREKYGHQRGARLQDIMNRSLSWIAQAATANKLKVIAGKGSQTASGKATPDDLPSMDLLQGVSNELVGTPYPLQEVLVELHWRTDQAGRAVRLPVRERVYSPVVALPRDGRQVLQFPFPFVDLVWGPEGLQLDAEAGRQLARSDVENLRLNPPRAPTARR